MSLHALSGKDLLKATGVGIATALILSAVMVPTFGTGLSPMPQPPSLAFAEALTDRNLPLPVGLLFHVAYVTFWSLVFVVWFRGRLGLGRALGLALVLWGLALVVFFPINGWGLLGLGVSPKLMGAALVPHLLFALVLWGLCRLAFGPGPSRATSSGDGDPTG